MIPIHELTISRDIEPTIENTIEPTIEPAIEPRSSEPEELESDIIHPFIKKLAQRVYDILGPGHSEYIYHRALEIELRNNNFALETEKRVLITYEDLLGHRNTLGEERIDIFIHRNEIINYELVIELKAVVTQPRQCEYDQVLKYKRELLKMDYNPRYGILINFPQSGTKVARESVDYIEISLAD